MTIAFVSRDFNGTFPNITPAGCTYYRCYLPMAVANHSARLGVPAWDSSRGYGIKESETTGLFGFDVVFMKLIMDRWAPKQIELAQSLGQKIIVDIDDFHEGLTPANKAFHVTDPELNKRANRDFYSQVIEAADIVTVSTPFLLGYYSTKRNNVHMIRNGVNLHQFTRRKHTSSKPVIGWAGAVSYRNNDLEQLREWLPDFLEEHDLMFHHAGHEDGMPSFADITGVSPNRVTTSPIVPISEYAAGLRFDIGIVPLSDIPFNEAKSNIKGLEYAAAGIPFVASPLPEYQVLHDDGVGMLAETPDEWRQHFETLLDYRTRKRVAAVNEQIVRKRWGIDSRADEWNRLFTVASLSTPRSSH
jgi:glycosyltransferase involved in cell wall biosynthesis